MERLTPRCSRASLRPLRVSSLLMSDRSKLFNQLIASSTGQELVKRVAEGGAVSCAGVDAAGWAHLGVALAGQTGRSVVLINGNLKQQETLQQDVETWLHLMQLQIPAFFYPDWEVLPHEDKLPHADAISERLEVLQSLAEKQTPVITTTVSALMQCTLPPAEVVNRTRTLKLGDRLDPLDFIEWLEGQGYEPEAQVTSRGEISLRGGIVDVFPFTTPWPVRCEFFGDELDSLRYFNPQSQVSREKINQASFSPGGEVGLLKRMKDVGGTTLIEHLPQDAILLFCDPDAIEQVAAEKVMEIPPGDRFHVEWTTLLNRVQERNITRVELYESESEPSDLQLDITSLEAFRPMGARIADPQIVEAQRREFFAQIHRWRRQDYTVSVFCNNEGEQQRLEELWSEYGFEKESGKLDISLGTLSRGFLFSVGQWVVVSDAEIFGRYKIQRPRRMKSRHGTAMKSAFDINFTELEEGDYVVHVQHGIGRYLGMKVMPLSGAKDGEDNSAHECVVIEYATSDPDNPPPKLYVPVSEAHLVSKYVGSGKMNPPLNVLGGKRWEKTKFGFGGGFTAIASDQIIIEEEEEKKLQEEENRRLHEEEEERLRIFNVVRTKRESQIKKEKQLIEKIDRIYKEELEKAELDKLTQIEKVTKLKEKRIQEENQAREELDKIHKKKIAEAEKERLDRLEEARKLIEKKLKEEEEVRLKEEKERKLQEEEERKIKASETRKLQEEEVKSSQEIERKNLEEIEERKLKELQEQEKTNQN